MRSRPARQHSSRRLEAAVAGVRALAEPLGRRFPGVKFIPVEPGARG
jgi:hypothetical protein